MLKKGQKKGGKIPKRPGVPVPVSLPSSEDELSVSEFQALVAILDALDREKAARSVGREIGARHLALPHSCVALIGRGGGSKMFLALSSRVAEHEGAFVVGKWAARVVPWDGNEGEGQVSSLPPSGSVPQKPALWTVVQVR